MTKKEQIARMKSAKRLLDDAFKAFNKSQTEKDQLWYLDCIQTIALSVKNHAGDVENEIREEMLKQ